MNPSEFADSFKKPREEEGSMKITGQDESVFMLLKYDDVKASANDTERFKSGVEVGRIVIPSEANIRTTRQIPVEIDPPEHTAYRNLLEDWFRRAFNADYKDQIDKIVCGLIDDVIFLDEIEVLEAFSLPLQSKALTVLLNVDPSEAETWITWGMHVFRSEDNPLDNDKANVLDMYLEEKIEYALENADRDDLYTQLVKSKYEGRSLIKEEIKGIMNLVFAGGRDTIINCVSNTIAYFASNPESLHEIRKNPKLIHKAVEEFFRYFSPLTHIGRVTGVPSTVCKHALQQNEKISLCWASANRDESIFAEANQVVLNRSKNPHLAFGFGPHNCIGAHHARVIMKSLVKNLTEKVEKINILSAEENIENWGEHNHKVGFKKLSVKFIPLEG